VLVVEDNELMTYTVRMMLESMGCTVQHAQTGRQALTMLDRMSVDFVITDIVMPGEMNGIKLAKTLRKQRPDLPVVLTTGFYSAGEEAVKDGFRILHKPYPIEKLAALLDEVLPHKPQ
jgi:CheY-like chemotaxis protein